MGNRPTDNLCMIKNDHELFIKEAIEGVLTQK